MSQLPGPPDDELLRRVRSGDLDAYGVLYARYWPAATRRARRWCSSSVAAEDIAAEAFVATLRAIENGAGPRDQFLAYLTTALRRRAERATFLQGRQRPLEAAETLPHVDDLPDLDLDGRIRRAFGQLCDRHRLVLQLVDVEGHEVAEVAQRLSISPNATAALLYRARTTLRLAYQRLDVPSAA